jgi:hypothetical protein
MTAMSDGVRDGSGRWVTTPGNLLLKALLRERERCMQPMATVPLRQVSPGVYEAETPPLTETGTWTVEPDPESMLARIRSPESPAEP